jgi:hypothetical protein
MKKFLFPLILAVISMMAGAQTDSTFIMYMHNGNLRAFTKSNVDSICYSYMGTDGKTYDDICTQLIYTKDSVIKTSLCEIDSITFLTLQTNPVTTHSGAIPLNAYGVWDRSDDTNVKYNVNADYFLGSERSSTWADIQPDGPGRFDFSGFQQSLEEAAKHGKLLKLSINVGPDSPKWLYENGVPSVKCNVADTATELKWSDYPYYLSDNYKKYYYELISEFARFLRNQPKSLRKAVGFVQVKTGCTGDECSYKGEPIEVAYKITNNQWTNFRLETFEVFRKAFNDIDKENTPPIALLFNNINAEDYPAENDWLSARMDPKVGYGIKGSAYVRGHHLTGEKSFKETWYKYLINSKGMILFSAAEMDQTWQKYLYNINTVLGFYWGALNGLNTGLSSWDISESACEYAEKVPDVQDIFRFFNKYASQIYSATANAAYIVFHEGLNSANTNKFPEAKYGKANMNNIDRYVAMCDDSVYKSRGAHMDDPESAALGQVRQRDSQKGYNDAGWDIEEGNYSRWIEQIDPDNTSVALFRVRGTIDASSSKYDRFARRFESATGKNTMYFKFDDEMFVASPPKSLKFTVTWLDKTAGSKWQFVYTGAGNKPKTALTVTGTGDNQWKKVDIPLIGDAVVNGKGERGSDFMLVNGDEKDDIFNGIEVDITR